MRTTTIQSDTDMTAVRELLKASNLPYNDIDLGKGLMVRYDKDNGELIGSGGLEFYNNYALLRSVAVEQSHRGRLIGTQIVHDLLGRAKEHAVKEVYLLTETAAPFFLSRGFIATTRDEVPGEIKDSSEFKSVCPVTAACLVYRF